MTAPTANPVPSAAPQDLLYNAEQIDKVVNSSEATYPDRFGVQRLTLAGAVDTIRAINVRGAWASGTSYAPKDVVSNSGTWYIAIDTHTAGASFAGDLAAHWRVYQGVVASDLAGYATEAEGAGLVGFDPTLNYAAATIGAALRYSIVYPHLFPWLAPTDGSDAGPAIRACIAANPGRTIYLSRAGGATYTISSTSSGAYLTLAALGTRLTGDPSVKLLFTDAAAYGINVTAGLCRIDSLMLWGTNTTAPTITALVHVATTAPNCTVANCNLAYAATAEHVESYIFRSIANSFSNCDRYLYTSGGTTADIQVLGDQYGTTHIGTNAVVEIAGSGGADIHARWEMMEQGKLALSVQTAGQRVIVRGKIENSGGIYVGPNAWLRLDVEALDSYTGTVFIDLADGGGRVDATGSTLNGPGATSGVTCVRSSSNFTMGSGTIEQWQVAGDFNADGNVNIGDVLVGGCTSGWDASSGTSGKVGPCTMISVTTPITRGASCDVNFVDGWTGKQSWTPGTIAAGSFATVTLTVTGVLPGDDGLVTYDQDLGGCTLHHQVRTDSIVVLVRNPTASGVTPTAGNLRYKVSGKAA